MNKIDWRKKLTSRKFWLTIATFGVAVVALFAGSPELADRISALILAGGAVITYVVSESAVDAAAAKQIEEKKESENEQKPSGGNGVAYNMEK